MNKKNVCLSLLNISNLNSQNFKDPVGTMLTYIVIPLLYQKTYRTVTPKESYTPNCDFCVKYYLEELDRETEEPEGLCRRRPRGGDPSPGRLLGDLDRRHGSFHSSGRLMTGTTSFFEGGSIGLLRRLKT